MEAPRIPAKEDKGYEGTKKRHFVFDNQGISGGVYMDRGKEVPKVIHLYLKKGVDKDAKCEGCDD